MVYVLKNKPAWPDRWKCQVLFFEELNFICFAKVTAMNVCRRLLPLVCLCEKSMRKKKKKNGEEQSGAEWGSTLHCRTPAIAQTEAIQKASDYRV